jgi:hypothetical protein
VPLGAPLPPSPIVASQFADGPSSYKRMPVAGSGWPPGLWRHASASRRGRVGDAGIRSGAIQSDPHGPAEAELRRLLANRAGAGSEPVD